MNRISSTFITALLMLLGTGSAVAQVSEDSMGKIIPAHLYACNFNDGQDASDLDDVIERWNRFMNEHEVDSYAAWTLVPYHFGPDQTFDIIWMGAYRDGNAMGAGTHIWLTEGGDLQDDFAEVLTCNAHVGFGSAMYKSPPDNATPGSSIISMSDCKLKDGMRYADVRAAEIKWAEYRTENGSTAGTWHWFPQYGGGDADFDYKILTTHADYNELGKDWERNANGGGREVSQGLFSDIDDCDDSRVYVATSRRAAQLRD